MKHHDAKIEVVPCGGNETVSAAEGLVRVDASPGFTTFKTGRYRAFAPKSLQVFGNYFAVKPVGNAVNLESLPSSASGT